MSALVMGSIIWLQSHDRYQSPNLRPSPLDEIARQFIREQLEVRVLMQNSSHHCCILHYSLVSDNLNPDIQSLHEHMLTTHQNQPVPSIFHHLLPAVSRFCQGKVHDTI